MLTISGIGYLATPTHNSFMNRAKCPLLPSQRINMRLRAAHGL